MSFPRCPIGFHRAKALLLAFTIIVVSGLTSALAVETDEQVVTGRWRLTSALDGAEITSLDEREARQLVGRVFTISKDKVAFGKRDCGPTDFEARSVEPGLFLREEFHATADKLGLPNPVTVVDLSCTSVFIKGKNKLVIAWDGWFFDAVRVKR
jgi:hypothetical protein